MRYSFAIAALMAAAASAAPSPNPQAPPNDLSVVDFGVKSDSDGGASSKAKRSANAELEVQDFGVQDDSDGKAGDKKLKKRCSNCISSCGDNWMYVFSSPTRQGYNDAVEAFCYHATHNLDNQPTTIGAGQYYSAQVGNGVKLSHGDNPAVINFEVHNKLSDGTHTIVEDDCNTYLKKLSASDSKCYGKKKIDTKGGTWQIGDNQISYHALGEAATN